MNRRGFFKAVLGIGAALAAPVIVSAPTEPKKEHPTEMFNITHEEYRRISSKLLTMWESVSILEYDKYEVRADHLGGSAEEVKYDGGFFWVLYHIENDKPYVNNRIIVNSIERHVIPAI